MARVLQSSKGITVNWHHIPFLIENAIFFLSSE